MLKFMLLGALLFTDPDTFNRSRALESAWNLQSATQTFIDGAEYLGRNHPIFRGAARSKILSNSLVEALRSGSYELVVERYYNYLDNYYNLETEWRISHLDNDLLYEKFVTVSRESYLVRDWLDTSPRRRDWSVTCTAVLNRGSETLMDFWSNWGGLSYTQADEGARTDALYQCGKVWELGLVCTVKTCQLEN